MNERMTAHISAFEQSSWQCHPVGTECQAHANISLAARDTVAACEGVITLIMTCFLVRLQALPRYIGADVGKHPVMHPMQKHMMAKPAQVQLCASKTETDTKSCVMTASLIEPILHKITGQLHTSEMASAT